MAIVFRFTSGVKPALFAFAGDRLGSRLPEKFGPWVADGIIRSSEAIPHKLDRETIEQSIEKQGYQLWRIKSEK